MRCSGAPCSGAGLVSGGQSGTWGLPEVLEGDPGPSTALRPPALREVGQPVRLPAEDPTSLGLTDAHPHQAMLSDGQRVSRDQGDRWPALGI